MAETWLRENRARWNELVAVHARARGTYDLEAFKAGRSTLRSVELAEVGEVRGKSLLHLQCHFGMDTLSWARHGAKATGVDFAPAAIDLARELSVEIGVPAEFVCSNVYELAENLDGEFDIVFTSYGVLCWLPDLPTWADVVAHFLAPGGVFYLVEQHPVGNVMVDRDGALVVAESYFDTGPVVVSADGSYADRNAVLQNNTSHEWQHSLSDVVNSLIEAGLRIEFVHEFPFAMFPQLASMVEDEGGWWHVPRRDDLPFLFSLKATRPGPPQPSY